MACALSNQSCRKGYRALYYGTSRLFDDLVLARATGTQARLPGRVARMDVVAIDDSALRAIGEQERHDLLALLEGRQGMRSMIVTSELPPENGTNGSASPH